MYDVVYYEEDRPQGNRRGYGEKEALSAEEDLYEDTAPRQTRHIARIQITNEDAINGNIRESGQHKEQARETRSAAAVKRNSSSHKNAQVTVTCNSRNIPPPPPAPSETVMRVTLPKAPPNKVAAGVREHEESSGRREVKQSEFPLEQHQGKTVSSGSRSGEKRPSQTVDKPGRMIVVNMGRSPQVQIARGGRPTMGSSGKPQTNPFLNGTEKRPQFEVPPPQQINNVQEVVQRMNSGDWPIKIEDDRCSVKSDQGVKVNRAQMSQRQQEKAHNWETLQRNKPAMEQSDSLENMERTQSSLSRNREQKMEKCPLLCPTLIILQKMATARTAANHTSNKRLFQLILHSLRKIITEIINQGFSKMAAKPRREQ
ncbi:hypothetical protein ANCCAN_18671 [Ancylostoma caninum]|uniref:Uncharacterized protein n=1 Tax=Ancylostoma caninum TaxID=29170 RepID=A0A368FVF2_ANCCA|nr:hypothetical protein ANCCAN_18671 [Ancylostoma caninum]